MLSRPHSTFTMKELPGHAVQRPTLESLANLGQAADELAALERLGPLDEVVPVLRQTFPELRAAILDLAAEVVQDDLVDHDHRGLGLNLGSLDLDRWDLDLRLGVVVETT